MKMCDFIQKLPEGNRCTLITQDSFALGIMQSMLKMHQPK